MSTIRLARIGQVAVTVSDLDRSTAFYRDALGMRLLFQAPNVAFFDCDGVRLMLGKGPADLPAEARRATLLYFRVDEIEAVHAALTGRGVSFEQAPHLVAKLPDHDLWLAFLNDPDGNVLGLMDEKRPPAGPATDEG
jgi:methylmalonyl-CoA/ethylmalonyl-CoA epimerase